LMAMNIHRDKPTNIPCRNTYAISTRQN
jgi:hypothetical protein